MFRIITLFSILSLLILLLIVFNFSDENAQEIAGTLQAKNLKEDKKQKRILTLENIFSEDFEDGVDYLEEELTVILATGDVIPARSVNYQIIKNKDFNWPYLKTADILRNADITFINLETPLLKNCPVTNEGMIFCSDEKNIEGLIYSGVDIVNLANNHAGNYGEKGVLETISLLENNNISTVGVSKSFIIKYVKGKKFAFLGYNDISKNQPGVSNTDDRKIITEISDANKASDVVIVAFHWGAEYKDQPDERQIYLGHLAIDAGADLVIGNHPHWIQPVEIYKEKIITYAHGNFVFDQEWSQKTKEGVVGKYIFYKDKLIDLEFLPVQIDNYGQPYFLDGERKKAILNNLKIESLKLNFKQTSN